MHNGEDEGSFKKKIDSFFKSVLNLWCGGSIVCVLGWQVFSWLKTGVWTSLAMHQVFSSQGIGLERIYYPTDWEGVAKVAQWFLAWPMVIGLPVWGGLVIAMVWVIFDRDTWS